jgi:hypothetical protein
MGINDGAESKSLDLVLKDESGVALIIVLLMVMLLSILSATMLATSSSELSIAGNYRNNETAFYAAESGVEFGSTFDQIYTSLYDTTTTWPAPGAGKILDANLAPTGTSNPNRDFNQIALPGGATADVKVEMLGNGKLPPGTGTQEDAGLSPGSGFKAKNYVVTVIGHGNNNSQSQIETQVARIVQQ